MFQIMIKPRRSLVRIKIDRAFFILVRITSTFFLFVATACSCRSGARVLGCCVHAATLIYFLSFARYNTVALIGKHLDSVLVDRTQLDSPKKPRYVRSKRRFLRRPRSPDTVEPDSSDTEIQNQPAN